MRVGNGRLIRTLWIIALASSSQFSIADEQQPGDDEDEHWSVSEGTQLDNKQGTLFDVSAGYFPSKAASWLLDVNRSNSASDVSGLTANAATLSFSRDGESFGFSIGGHWFNDVDIVTGKEATLALTMRSDYWHANVNGEYRQSDFDPFTANTIVRRRDGTLVPVTATATCKLSNIGYGAEVGLDGTAWRGYLKAMQYSYGENECSFNSPGLNALERTNRQEFLQLANVLTRRLSRMAVSHLQKNNGNSFLASEQSAGVKYAAEKIRWGFDYAHSREEFEGLISNTYTGSADIEVFRHSDVEVQLGASESESVGTVAFLGITLTTRF